MAELRWNPMIKDWVMIASHRQNRPHMPKDWCPFCPGSGKVPDTYDVHKYDNDFPALSTTPPPCDFDALPAGSEDVYGPMAPSYGKCEVVLFSPDHHGNMCDLSDAHMNKLVDLWVERFEALSQDKQIRFVYIFENRGEAVGVTMPHPHGQIYAFSKLPKKIELELDAGKEYYDTHGRCLFCRMNELEQLFAKRVVYENEDFLAYIPYFADYAYGVYMVSKSHKINITQCNAREKENLGKAMRAVSGGYDALFDTRFPYMMCMHNGPVNLENQDEIQKQYHFHIEYYPPLRSKEKQQFQASSETGVWAHCNPTAPEEKAEELKKAILRFLQQT